MEFCRGLNARCRDAKGCGEGREVRVRQLGLICLLVGGSLQIVDHPKGVIVDDNQRKADSVTHAGGQFLSRVEKTSVADQADNRAVRSRQLDANGGRKAEAEQTGTFGPDNPVGPVGRIKILGPIAKLGVINNEGAVSWQHGPDRLERLKFGPLLAEALELRIGCLSPGRSPFLAWTGVGLSFELIA